ncbi:MAG: flavin reductase family protein [Pseudomonadota bacterium]
MADHDFTFVDARELDTAAAYRMVIGCVVPRPIAWVTTVDGRGCVNAAPFSSYNYVATTPPMLAINIASREGSEKDTARNIRETGEFVVNVATEASMEAMHACGENYAPGISEAEALGIALLPSRLVKPPRIAVSPVQMEMPYRPDHHAGQRDQHPVHRRDHRLPPVARHLRRQARGQRKDAARVPPGRTLLRGAWRDISPAHAAAPARW